MMNVIQTILRSFWPEWISRSVSYTCTVVEVCDLNLKTSSSNISLICNYNWLKRQFILEYWINKLQLIVMAVQPTLQCPKKVSVKLGKQANISCNETTGDPKPNNTWTKDSHVISHSLILVIDNVSISDGGPYIFTANNGRSVKAQVELDVLCKYVSN